jgi:hypothetical protein
VVAEEAEVRVGRAAGRQVRLGLDGLALVVEDSVSGRRDVLVLGAFGGRIEHNSLARFPLILVEQLPPLSFNMLEFFCFERLLLFARELGKG